LKTNGRPQNSGQLSHDVYDNEWVTSESPQSHTLFSIG
jgi:hypothetical protein